MTMKQLLAAHLLAVAFAVSTTASVAHMKTPLNDTTIHSPVGVPNVFLVYIPDTLTCV